MRPRIWYGRIVLVLASLLLLRVGGGLMVDPVGGVAAQGISLPTKAAVTSMRAVGGGFVGVALALLLSLRSARTLVSGLSILLMFVGGLTAGRLLGLGMDGAAPFTLRVLAPELALVMLSGSALLFARQRGTDAGAAWSRPSAGEELS